MTQTYPILISPTDCGGYLVTIPDFDMATQGTSIADGMYMARDAIGLMGITMEDDGAALPSPSSLKNITPQTPEDTITLVDVDFTAYRRQNDNRTVRRNVSLPSWLNAAAEQAGVNVSAILQAALKEQLHLN